MENTILKRLEKEVFPKMKGLGDKRSNIIIEIQKHKTNRKNLQEDQASYKEEIEKKKKALLESLSVGKVNKGLQEEIRRLKELSEDASNIIEKIDELIENLERDLPNIDSQIMAAFLASQIPIREALETELKSLVSSACDLVDSWISAQEGFLQKFNFDVVNSGKTQLRISDDIALERRLKHSLHIV